MGHNILRKDLKFCVVYSRKIMLRKLFSLIYAGQHSFVRHMKG